MSMYRGFSTIERDFGPYTLTDKDLIVRDLLNHFYIRKGEKLHNPEVGCIIWSRLFDPLTGALKDEIVKDIDRIVRSDPRLQKLQAITITEVNNGIVLDVRVALSNTNQVANLKVLFDKTSSTLVIL